MEMKIKGNGERGRERCSAILFQAVIRRRAPKRNPSRASETEVEQKVLSHYYKSVFIFISLYENIKLFNKRIAGSTGRCVRTFTCPPPSLKLMSSFNSHRHIYLLNMRITTATATKGTKYKLKKLLFSGSSLRRNLEKEFFPRSRLYVCVHYNTISSVQLGKV